jgi:hypothetical protein
MRAHKFGVIAGLLAVTACGGGGGGNSAPNTGPASSSPPASGSQLRIMKEGDQFSYAVSFSDPSNAQSGTGSLDVVFSGSYTNSHGIKCLNMTRTAVSSALGKTSTVTSKSPGYQDSDGAIYSCGDYIGANVVEVDSPDGLSKETPSPLQVGQAFSYLTTLTDGTWSDCTANVEAFESVNVPAGSFDAYRIKETCSESDGTNNIVTRWLSPTHFLIQQEYQQDSEAGAIVLKSFSLAP